MAVPSRWCYRRWSRRWSEARKLWITGSADRMNKVSMLMPAQISAAIEKRLDAP
ncbi:hypothetical protein [Telmatospirillum siberiense]|uniref:hypothetical protein n=1 Tax=Telmatospirillum siberiense TaxID=382514 RepID=UPI0013045336|nr:hypothetical protein [Telmatospirillum siberiense]